MVADLWGLGGRWNFVTECEHPVTRHGCLCLDATVWDKCSDKEAPLLSTLAVWEGILGHNHSQ